MTKATGRFWLGLAIGAVATVAILYWVLFHMKL